MRTIVSFFFSLTKYLLKYDLQKIIVGVFLSHSLNPDQQNLLTFCDAGVIRLNSGNINLDRDKYELNVTAMDDGKCCSENGKPGDHTKERRHKKKMAR